MAGPLLALLLAIPAEPPLPAVLTLPEALRIFHERSFDLLLADAQVAASRGDQAAAGAAVEAARLSRDDAERTLRLALQQAVVDAALQRAQLDLAGELRDFARQTEQLDQTRYRVGAISEAELARAQVALLEAEQAVDLAQQADRAARAGVAFLLAVRGPLPDFRIDPELLEQASRLALPAA